MAGALLVSAFPALPSPALPPEPPRQAAGPLPHVTPAELGPLGRMEPAAALAACPVLIKAGRPAG